VADRVTAILLAGQRPEGDALAERFGVPAKALIPVRGRSMLSRVAATLLTSWRVERVVVLAQNPQTLVSGDAASLLSHERIRFLPSGPGIAASILEVAGSAEAPWPVLVTTADHVLLTHGMIDALLDEAGARDVVAGVAERRTVEAAYPLTRRTWLRFSDGHFSGANLFLLRGCEVAPALEAWSAVEQRRKTAWRLFAGFGPSLLLRALTRSIELDDAVRRAGARLGVRAGVVVLPQAEAAIDVDKLEDLELVERILAGR
jgi:GTP:adenosylcobinamide-phosphate guanylyltransferase